MFAQCPLTTAVDFTATDCHGTEVHLFDILDGGQYVLIDFFYYSCSACNQTAPYMVQSYSAFGCNQHDVFYMEISDRDSDAVCQNWVNNYGVEYPTISGAAGGAAINDQYGIGAYPTVILIAPDRHIVINDLWPINNAQTVINQLQNYGIQQYDCEPGPTGEVTLSTSELYCFEYWGEPYCDMFTIFNMTDSDVQIIGYESEEFEIQCTDDFSFCSNDVIGMTIAPSDSLEVYVTVWGTRQFYEGTMSFTTSWGVFELNIHYSDELGVNEFGANNFSLYPNPANDIVRISGNNLGNISIFNTLGQVIFEGFATDDLNINTSDFENGVYFVKVGDKTQKFVVTH
ncbi:MAG: T9SS type A sorting domain-containing protein [Bacteroidales bacterium]|nr:T9SS type A sorting domain-containing protein [Bacteroidales bacterium]